MTGQYVILQLACLPILTAAVGPPAPHRLLEGHAGLVSAIAFSPDATTVATADACGDSIAIHLWNVASAKQSGVLTGHTQGVTSLAFSPDGALLASASNDRSIIIWDLPTRKPRCVLRGYDNLINAICFSPDGSKLVSGDVSKILKVWDVKTEKLICTLRGHTEIITAVEFFPDGKVLASGSLDMTVKLWDIAQEKQIGAMEHRGPVFSLAFSPDGNSMVTGCAPDFEAFKTVPNVTWKDVMAALRQPGEVVLWDVATRQKRTSFRMPAGRASSVAFVGDERRVVVGTMGFCLPNERDQPGEVLIFDILNGASSKVIEPRPFAHGVTAVAVSRGGRWLAAASSDRAVRVWDVQKIPSPGK